MCQNKKLKQENEKLKKDNVKEKLKEYNPEIVKSVTFAEEPIEKMTQIQVVYNKVDLYTAKLMAKKIGGNVKLVESNKMNNRIVVVSKN